MPPTPRAERFVLIILDVMLPGFDGVTLCRALRTDGASRDSPILMLTARGVPPDDQQRRVCDGRLPQVGVTV